MRTIEVEVQLFKKFDVKKTLNVTNLTKKSKLVMFETDYLTLTNSGYATGIEIKVSKADLKADLKKTHIARLTSEPLKSWGKKTALDVYYKRLKYFYYAVPSELTETALEQIPDFAGLMCVHSKGVTIVRKPKQLFKYKWSEAERYNLARLGTMRALTLKKRIIKLENDIQKSK